MKLTIRNFFCQYFSALSQWLINNFWKLHAVIKRIKFKILGVIQTCRWVLKWIYPAPWTLTCETEHLRSVQKALIKYNPFGVKEDNDLHLRLTRLNLLGVRRWRRVILGTLSRRFGVVFKEPGFILSNEVVQKSGSSAHSCFSPHKLRHMSLKIFDFKKVLRTHLTLSSSSDVDGRSELASFVGHIFLALQEYLVSSVWLGSTIFPESLPKHLKSF